MVLIHLFCRWLSRLVATDNILPGQPERIRMLLLRYISLAGAHLLLVISNLLVGNILRNFLHINLIVHVHVNVGGIIGISGLQWRYLGAAIRIIRADLVLTMNILERCLLALRAMEVEILALADALAYHVVDLEFFLLLG